VLSETVVWTEIIGTEGCHQNKGKSPVGLVTAWLPHAAQILTMALISKVSERSKE
jgi:hypothetical protein